MMPHGLVRTAYTAKSALERPRVAKNRMAAVRAAGWLCGAILATPALAEPPCAPTDAVADRLRAEFGETPQESGFNGVNIIAMYANPETGTWTLLALTPDGLACLVSYGEMWTDMAEGDPA